MSAERPFDAKRKAEDWARLACDSTTLASSKRRNTSEEQLSALEQRPAPGVLPPYGTCSLVRVREGRSNEDTWEARANVLPADSSGPLAAEQQSALSLFAVYDGHGGDSASKHCATTLHQHLRGRLQLQRQESGVADVVQHMEPALEAAFLATDSDLRHMPLCSSTGSTATVAVVDDRRIWLAHVGDSRAVICRNGQAANITRDHKPDLEDEKLRVEEAGGSILWNSGHRVMGVLATTRAIGDHDLQPYGVTPLPEVCCLERSGSVEYAILASDGLWDKVSCQEACDMAHKVMLKVSAQHKKQTPCIPCKAAHVTAVALARCARGRQSRDDITVLVINLRAKCTCADFNWRHESSTACKAAASSLANAANAVGAAVAAVPAAVGAAGAAIRARAESASHFACHHTPHHEQLQQQPQQQQREDQQHGLGGRRGSGGPGCLQADAAASSHSSRSSATPGSSSAPPVPPHASLPLPAALSGQLPVQAAPGSPYHLAALQRSSSPLPPLPPPPQQLPHQQHAPHTHSAPTAVLHKLLGRLGGCATAPLRTHTMSHELGAAAASDGMDTSSAAGKVAAAAPASGAMHALHSPFVHQQSQQPQQQAASLGQVQGGSLHNQQQQQQQQQQLLFEQPQQGFLQQQFLQQQQQQQQHGASLNQQQSQGPAQHQQAQHSLPPQQRVPPRSVPSGFKSPFMEHPFAMGSSSFGSASTSTASGASASGALASHLQQQLSISHGGCGPVRSASGALAEEGGRSSRQCSAELLAS